MSVLGTLQSFDIPGGHSSMLQEPNVRVMAEKTQSCINAALDGGSSEPPSQEPADPVVRHIRLA